MLRLIPSSFCLLLLTAVDAVPNGRNQEVGGRFALSEAIKSGD